MRIVVVSLLTLCGLLVGIFLFAYGLKAGYIDKKILHHYPDTYVYGEEASQRGWLYMILSTLLFIAPSLFIACKILIYLFEKQ